MERPEIVELFYSALISPNDVEQLFEFLGPRVEWILSAANPQTLGKEFPPNAKSGSRCRSRLTVKRLRPTSPLRIETLYFSLLNETRLETNHPSRTGLGVRSQCLSTHSRACRDAGCGGARNDRIWVPALMTQCQFNTMKVERRSLIQYDPPVKVGSIENKTVASLSRTSHSVR
jgi:hypothetical protein